MFVRDDGEIYGWLVLGMVNLAVIAAAAGAVVLSPAYARAAPAARVSSHCTRSE